MIKIKSISDHNTKESTKLYERLEESAFYISARIAELKDITKDLKSMINK